MGEGVLGKGSAAAGAREGLGPAGDLSAAETDALDELALPVLRRLVRIDSQNPGGSEAAVADEVLSALAELGSPVPDACVMRVDHAPGRSSLVVTLPGDGPRVGLAGHMDTVPAGDASAWAHQPLSAHVEGTTVWGRGTTDMKGGDTAMLLAYLSYARTGRRPPCTLRLYLTADEEGLGMGASALEGMGAFDDLDFLFVCEPTDLRPGTCEKGCLWARIKARGASSHASMPQLGANALEGGLARVLAAKRAVESLAGAHPLLGTNTCTLTLAQGGTKANMVPDAASFTLDARLVPQSGTVRAQRAIREALLRDASGGVSVDVSFENCREPLQADEGHPATRLAQACCECAGASSEPAGVRFYTDASLVVPRHPGLPFLVLGPGDPAQCHVTDEHADVVEVMRAWHVLRSWLDRCAGVL